jgi:PAS domain-containing protein
MTDTAPYALPQNLDPDQTRVLAYWEGLKRGDADMPFSDDVDLSALPDLAANLMLLEVGEAPTRFRFGMVGEEINRRCGGDLMGKFVDEIISRPPFEFLNSQVSATVESRAPTYYRHATPDTADPGAAHAYSRLILPLWGDGAIRMLLCAVK